MPKERYYICPRCRDLTTWTKILEEVGGGSCGMCYCEFNNGRILHKYKRISQKKWNDLNKDKSKGCKRKSIK